MRILWSENDEIGYDGILGDVNSEYKGENLKGGYICQQGNLCALTVVNLLDNAMQWRTFRGWKLRW